MAGATGPDPGGDDRPRHRAAGPLIVRLLFRGVRGILHLLSCGGSFAIARAFVRHPSSSGHNSLVILGMA